MGLTQLCTGPLWNSSITWYTDHPDFTSCFHKTVLVYLPCIFLWFMAPLELWLGVKSSRRFIPWSWVNVSKLTFDSLLVLVTGFNLCFVFWLHEMDPGFIQLADFIGPVIKLATFCLDITLVILARRSGIHIQNSTLKRLLSHHLSIFLCEPVINVKSFAQSYC